MINEFVTFLTVNKGYSMETARAYRNDLQDFAKFAREQNPDAKWSTITQEEIEAYVAYMVNELYARTTIKRKVSSIRSIYSWFRTRKMLDKNPARFVSTPKAGTREPKTVEVEAIRKVLNDGQISLVTRMEIAIIAETGVRISELMAIRGIDIDEEHQQIHVIGKGNKERTVNYGHMTAQLWTLYKSDTANRIFTETVEQASRNIHFALKKYSAQQYLSPHILRHTFATEMARNGAQLQAIQQQLGHASSKTTEIYAHKSQSGCTAQYLQFAPIY